MTAPQWYHTDVHVLPALADAGVDVGSWEHVELQAEQALWALRSPVMATTHDELHWRIYVGPVFRNAADSWVLTGRDMRCGWVSADVDVDFGSDFEAVGWSWHDTLDALVEHVGRWQTNVPTEHEREPRDGGDPPVVRITSVPL